MQPNAISILGRVCRAMREAGLSDTDIAVYVTAAMSGDYDHLIQVTMRTVEVE